MHEFFRKLGWLTGRRRKEAELREELEFHLAEDAEEREADGMTKAQARAAARCGLGSVALVTEDTAAAWGWPLLDELAQDLRYATRLLLKNPGFSAIAVLSLALGIGANSMVFSLVNAVLFKPLPVDDPDRLVWFYATLPKSNEPRSLSYPDFEDHRARTTVFSDVFAFRELALRVAGGAEPVIVWGAEASGNFFTGLGLKAQLGRTFVPDDGESPGTVPLAVIADGLWRRLFGADPSAIGRTLTLNGHDFTIVGVLPPEFSGTRAFGFIPDVWIPFAMHDHVSPSSTGLLRNRGAGSLFVMARMKPGTTGAQADASVGSIAEHLNLEHRQPATSLAVRTIAGSRKINPYIENMGVLPLASLLTLLTAGFVLLIACANVANLTLARIFSRAGEISIRLAIGASRWRLARQMLTESLLLSVLGGVAGLLMGRWLVGATSAFKPSLDFEVFEVAYTFSLDWRIVGFTTLATFLAGVVSGLTPSAQASGSDITGSLKGAVPGTGHGKPAIVRNALIVTQVALCIVLLVGAGISLQSARNARLIDPGFATERLLMMRVNLELQEYDQLRRKQFYRDARQQLDALPGVEQMAMGFPLPLDAFDASRTAVPEGFVPEPGTERGFNVAYSVVSPNYFRTMGTQLVTGREFNDFDTESSDRVVIVNQTLARQWWPGQDPLGKRVRLGLTEGPFATVIAVARDGKYLTLGEAPRMYMFLAALQVFPNQASIIVRTAGGPATMTAAVRGEIQKLDSGLAILGVQTIDQYRDRLLSITDMLAALMGGFGAVALALASFGLYGVISFSVAQRAREIGIRMAIGARRQDVIRMIVRQSMRQVLIGCLLGFAAAVAFAKLMMALLFGVSPTNVPTLASVLALVLLVAALAAYVPARRAATTDPLATLRAQ